MHIKHIYSNVVISILSMFERLNILKLINPNIESCDIIELDISKQIESKVNETIQKYEINFA